MSFGASYTQSSPTRGVWLLAAGMFLLLASAGASTYALAKTTSPLSVGTVSSPAAAIAPATIPAPATSATTTLPPTPAKPRGTAAPSCQRGSYSLPGSLSASGKSSGVYVQVDPASNYRVYGASRSEILNQIAACTPVRSGGLFAANTGYSLSDYYSYAAGSDGRCRVTTAVITLHVNQVFPSWTASNGTSSSLVSSWNNFNVNLKTHEQGHVDLDKSYAARLYQAITQVSPQSCDTIKSAITSTANGVLAELADANNDYDAITNHGTAQGAVM